MFKCTSFSQGKAEENYQDEGVKEEGGERINAAAHSHCRSSAIAAGSVETFRIYKKKKKGVYNKVRWLFKSLFKIDRMENHTTFSNLIFSRTNNGNTAGRHSDFRY